MSTSVQNILETRQRKIRRLLDKTPPHKTSPKHQKRISNPIHCIGNAKNRKNENRNISSIKDSAQKQSTCEGVMIWAINKYTEVYRLTARPLASTYLCDKPRIMVRSTNTKQSLK